MAKSGRTAWQSITIFVPDHQRPPVIIPIVILFAPHVEEAEQLALRQRSYHQSGGGNMTTCQACSGQINRSDRYCRTCGAPVAVLVGDLVDTHPFDSSEAVEADRRKGSEDSTEQFYSPPAGVERFGRTASSVHPTGPFIKRLFEPKRNWMIIVSLLVLLLLVLAGTGITIGKNVLRRMVRQRVADQVRLAQQAAQKQRDRISNADALADEAVQNGLGFVPADLSNDEYPDIDGI